MKNTTLDLRTYAFTPNDQLLFDANIWMFIYGPQRNPTDWRPTLYSRALSNALSAVSSLFIDVLVLSEYINRHARLEHQVLISAKAAPDDFKQFRKSPDYQPIALAIAGNVRRILQLCHRVESDFESLDIVSLINEFETTPSDFNDLVLASLCQSRGLTLVTHDSDYKDRGLRVITANSKLMT
jgi:predicted nucleic acid-binding protein